MDSETSKKIFVEKKKGVFRLYSMEYVIEQCDDNRIVMYAEQYKNDKHYYNSIEELFNNYRVYNEVIMDNINRIKVIE